jgi:hypothetical protein
LVLYIYITALLGMSFFAGNAKFNTEGALDLLNGTPPRNNFDTISWAVLTLFQLLLGDGWPGIMYSCMRTLHEASAVYFILVMLTGHIIMLNLFLAVLLGNFEKARSFELKKRLFDAFSEITSNNLTLNQTVDIVFGEMSAFVKTKILRWNESMVLKLHTDGDSMIAQDLVEGDARFMKENFHRDAKNEFGGHKNVLEKVIDPFYVNFLTKQEENQP